MTDQKIIDYLDQFCVKDGDIEVKAIDVRNGICSLVVPVFNGENEFTPHQIATLDFEFDFDGEDVTIYKFPKRLFSEEDRFFIEEEISDAFSLAAEEREFLASNESKLKDVMHKEDFAELMENCGMEATEGNLNKVWSVFPDNIPSGSTLKDLALAAIHSSMAKEPLEFVFDDEIEISDDSQALEGYVWATNSLVDRLKAQEPPLDEDQFMENINFYPVYNMNSGTVSLEGHYYLEDGHYATGKAFALPLTPDESNRLREAFEAYCLKREGKSCLSFLRDMKSEYNQEHKSLADQIQAAQIAESIGASEQAFTSRDKENGSDSYSHRDMGR